MPGSRIAAQDRGPQHSSMEAAGREPLPPAAALSLLAALGLCAGQPADRSARHAARLSAALEDERAAAELVGTLRRLGVLSDDEAEAQPADAPAAAEALDEGVPLEAARGGQAQNRYSRGRMSSWARRGEADETEGESAAPPVVFTRARAASESMGEMGFQAVQGALREATCDDSRVVANATMRQLTASVTDGVEAGGALPDTFSREGGQAKNQLRRWMAEWLHERLYNPSPLVKHKVLTTMTLLCERGPDTFLPKLRIKTGLRAEIDALQSYALPAEHKDPVHGDRPAELVRHCAAKLLERITHGNDFDFGPDLIFIRGPPGSAPALIPGIATVGAAGFVFQAPRQGTLFELKISLAKLLFAHVAPAEVSVPADTPRLSEYSIPGHPMREATLVFCPPGQQSSESLVVVGSEEIVQGLVVVLQQRLDALLQRKATSTSSSAAPGEQRRGSIIARMRSTARRPSV